MAGSRRQSSALQRLLAVAILIAGTLLAPRCSFSEIIVDDFDDAVQIVLPQMENQSIMTPGVGVLNADRFIDVSSSRTDPIGLVDVDITKASHLTTRIDGQIPAAPQSNPLLSFGAGYRFADPVDLTEGGVNDAMFIDSTIFQGSGIPSALSVLVRDANDVFAAIVSGFNLPSNSPYTVTLPFSSFGFRGGGGVGLADLSMIDLFEVRVHLLGGSRNPDTNWLVQIDRIRLGRSAPIPEPDGWRLAILAAAIVAINLLPARIS